MNRVVVKFYDDTPLVFEIDKPFDRKLYHLCTFPVTEGQNVRAARAITSYEEANGFRVGSLVWTTDISKD